MNGFPKRMAASAETEWAKALMDDNMIDGEQTLACSTGKTLKEIFDRGTMPATAELFRHAAFLALRLQGCDEYSMCLRLEFYEEGQRERGEEPTMYALFGLLPGVETTVHFDLRWLDGQTLFAPRTPGRLKMTIFGKPLRKEDVASIVLSADASCDGRRLRVWPAQWTDAIAPADLPAHALVDEMGQWKPRQWPGKTASRDACDKVLRQLAEPIPSSDVDGANARFVSSGRDAYGGYRGVHADATGWFRVWREPGDDGRFWLLDPDGNAFISVGADCINPGIDTRVDPVLPWVDRHVRELVDAARRNELIDDPDFSFHDTPNTYCGFECSYDYAMANLRHAFGTSAWDAWKRIVMRHFHDWGMNTIGNWSDRELMRTAGIPYVLPADTLREYPRTATMVFRDFPDVFSPEYERNAAAYAQGLEDWRDDRNMIGYFMRNEPNWAFVYDLNLAEEMLANPAHLASKEALATWLADRYHGDASAWRRSWRIPGDSGIERFEDLIARPRYRCVRRMPGSVRDLHDFSTLMIDRYVRIPAEALRRVDPHHLNLGMRYAYITDPTLLAGSDCYDVFSINSYQMTCYDQVEELGKTLNMPVMVGEFHHGALDRGLSAHGIRGVRTQEDRGKAYRYYIEQALRSLYFVGAHYFQYNDQSALGRFDGENYQIGLVDVCSREYPEMAQAMRECHDGMYDVAMGRKAPYNACPEEVAPIHY